MPGDILTALNAGSNLATQLMAEKVKINNELAQADYKDQQYKFNDAFQSMMLDFNNRNDYELFQQEYDDFFTQWKNQVNSNAKTAQSAKALSEMVDGTYIQYKYSLEQSVINSQRNAVRSMHAEDIQRVKSDSMMSTEDKVASILNTNNEDYRSGYYTSAQEYEQKTLSDITDVVLNDSKNIGLNILAAGGSLEDACSESFKGVDKDLKIGMLQAGTLADEDRSGSLNKEAIKSQIRNELTTYWNTVVKNTQNENEIKLSEQYAKLLQLSGNELLTGIGTAYNKLNSMTGNSLVANVRDEYATKFKKLYDALEDPNSVTKSGNDKVKVALYESLIDNPDAVALALKNGKYEDMYCAKEAIMRQDKAMYEEAIGKTLTDEQYMYARASEINDFMSNLVKSGALPSKATAIVTAVKGLLDTAVSKLTGKNAKDWAKDNGVYYDIMINDVEAMAMDLLYECDLSDQSEIDGLISKFETRVGAMYLGLLDFDTNRKLGESEDKVYSRLVENLGNEASAMTLGESEDETFAPGAKEASEKTAAYTKKKMAEAGITPLGWEYSKSDHDVDALPIVSGMDGNKYRLASNNGSTELQKQNGDNWVAVVAPVVNDRKSVRKSYVTKVNEEEKADNQVIDQILASDTVPYGFDEANWWNMDDGAKRTALEQIAQRDAERWAKIKSKLN